MTSLRTLIGGGMAIAMWLLTTVALAQLPASYTDPAGYPGAWPSNYSLGCSTCFQPYSYKGDPASDSTGSADGSSGGTTPQSSADIVNDGNGVSTYFYGNGTSMYFRFTLNGPPGSLTGNGQPYSSTNWSILIDVDGDGYKEFAVMLFGSDGGAQPDDLLVMYDNSASQALDQVAYSIWRQDSARHPTLATTADGEPGGSVDWDVNPDAYVWNFSRSRIVQLDRSLSPGSNNSRYYVDVQVPLAAFDARGRGGPQLTSTSHFSFAYSTANSNTNPAQKDFGFPGDYIFSDVTQRLPFGDSITPTGAITQKPLVSAVTAGTCGVSTALTANVIDTLETWGSNQLRTSVRRVDFYYLYDTNRNGVADPEETWTIVSPGITMSTSPTSTSVSGGTVESNVNPWSTSWNATELPQGSYLIKAIATDDQSNVTDSSTVQGTTANLAGVHAASFNNTCGRPAADLSIVKSASPAQPIAGQNINYTLSISNEGPSAATSVTVTDTLPASLTFVSCSVSGGTGGTCSGTGNARTVTFSELPTGTGIVATVTLVARIAPSLSHGSTVVNTASIASATFDPKTTNDSSTVTSTVVRRADLRIAKTATPSPITAGNQVTYQLTVTNDGPSDASDVRVTDTLTAKHAFVSCVVVSGPTGTCGGTGLSRFVDFPSFPASASATVTIVAQVLPSLPDGSTLTNSARVSTSTSDPNGANDRADTAIPVIARADLAVTKTAAPEPAVAGDELTYTLELTNDGPSDATTVHLVDTLPADTVYESCTVILGPVADCVVSGTTVTYSTSTLSAGATASVELVVHTSPSLAAGDSVTNTATASSDVTDPQAANDTGSVTSTLTRQSDLSVTKQIDVAFPIRGDTVRYTLTVANAGPSDVGGVSISDALPAEVTFVASDGCTASPTGGTPICDLGSIVAGSNQSFFLTVTVNGDAALGALVENLASIATADAPDPVPGNDSATASFTVSGLELTKSACNLASAPCSAEGDFTSDPLVGDPGDAVVYRVRYENFGGAIFDVLLHDQLPGRATLLQDAYVGGTELLVSCPNSDVVYLEQAAPDEVNADLVLACSLDTAADGDGIVREALLPGQSGYIEIRATID